jgi:hypothetical protein
MLIYSARHPQTAAPPKKISMSPIIPAPGDARAPKINMSPIIRVPNYSVSGRR